MGETIPSRADSIVAVVVALRGHGRTRGRGGRGPAGPSRGAVVHCGPLGGLASTWQGLRV